MMKSTHWRSTLFALFVFSSCAVATADMLVRNPTADAQANYFLSPFPTLGVLFDGNSDILVESDSSENEFSAALFEFDIAELDSGKTVQSASIQFYVNLWTGTSAPEARSGVYDGQDGSITPADFTAAAASLLAGTQVVDLGLVTIILNPAEVQAVVDTDTDYLGLLLSITEDNHNYRIATIENSFFDHAELTIIFVPEPATFALLGAGLAALLLVRRHRC